MNQRQSDEERKILGPRGLLVARSSRNRIPLTGILELTHRCNESCIHCYVVQPGKSAPPELSTEAWMNILGQLAKAGTMEITFSGGEVFLRRDLFDLLREARRLDFSIKISTNATLIGDTEADQLAELKPWEIGVSLYGGDADTHDSITTRVGSFDDTVAGVHRLTQRGVRVKIRSVLMKENTGQEEQLAALAQSLGASFNQDPLLTPKSDGSLDNLIHRLSTDELRRALVPELKRFSGGVDEQRWEELRQTKLRDNLCKAGVNFFSINPYGIVLPCVQFQLPAGDLTKEPFKSIWNHSDIFNRLRNTCNADIPGCNTCYLLPICFRCPGEALLTDGDAFLPSTYACMRSSLIDELRQISEGT